MPRNRDAAVLMAKWPKRPRRTDETDRCYRGQHELCKGVAASKYGMKPKCVCKCHNSKESTEAVPNHGK